MPARAFSPHTRKSYLNDIFDLKTFIEEERDLRYWKDVAIQDLQKYLALLDEQGLKKTTVRRKICSIKTFFHFLVDELIIETDPALRLIPPRVLEQEARVLNKQEYQGLLSVIASTRDRTVVTVFLQTGIRLSELVNLNLDDVSLPRHIKKTGIELGDIRVVRKGGKVDYVPLNWKAAEALKQWLGERKRKAIIRLAEQKPIDPDALFLNKYGQRFSQRAVQRMVKKYLDLAGVKNASVHTLRHTMATHMHLGGMGLPEIKKMLAHASIETTSRYVRASKTLLNENLQKLAL